MSVEVKICGLTDPESLHAAIEAGARYIGFVLIPSSKRYVSPAQAKEWLATLPTPTLCRFTKGPAHSDGSDLVLTVLFQDPTDEEIDAALCLKPLLGLIQLHGLESPARVAEIREKTGIPVMKVIPIGEASDFDKVGDYDSVAEMYLFDTKVGPTPTGGTGKSFDWSLLTGRTISKPWMLAGGLNKDNVLKAIDQSGARIVDVSSGVERENKKDPEKIKAFVKVCHERQG